MPVAPKQHRHHDDDDDNIAGGGYNNAPVAENPNADDDEGDDAAVPGSYYGNDNSTNLGGYNGAAEDDDASSEASPAPSYASYNNYDVNNNNYDINNNNPIDFSTAPTSAPTPSGLGGVAKRDKDAAEIQLARGAIKTGNKFLDDKKKQEQQQQPHASKAPATAKPVVGAQKAQEAPQQRVLSMAERRQMLIEVQKAAARAPEQKRTN